ncbi:hypothetical protein ACN38_g8601 [Penicillium nordicum]|uniref:Uncharacterized protein n=1 Tax=Penicillium nordicum TaxID=229535 RepID=A0A0M8NW41_9EURO|nr:hypothetical protein ACN38_g8601 [Penicillium nordicum]
MLAEKGNKFGVLAVPDTQQPFQSAQYQVPWCWALGFGRLTRLLGLFTLLACIFAIQLGYILPRCKVGLSTPVLSRIFTRHLYINPCRYLAGKPTNAGVRGTKRKHRKKFTETQNCTEQKFTEIGGFKTGVNTIITLEQTERY